jgi:hypothetical protein
MIDLTVNFIIEKNANAIANAKIVGTLFVLWHIRTQFNYF